MPAYYKIIVNSSSFNLFIEVDFDLNMSLYKPILSAKRNEFPEDKAALNLLNRLSLDIMD